MTRPLLLAAALTAGCASPTVTAHIAAAPSPLPPITSPVPLTTGEAEVAPARPTPTRASRSRRVGQVLQVTAYCATGHRTASGLWPRIGMAAGPWPFGTRLRVEGVGVVTVQDRYGSATQLDLFYGEAGCERRARAFGRQLLRVQVIR